MMVNFLATATLAISMMARPPKAPQWEDSYGKALEATRAGQDPLLVVLDKPDSKEARVEPALLSEDNASSDNFEAAEPVSAVPCRCFDGIRSKGCQAAFKAKEFPHVAIIDKTGSVVIFRKTGQIKDDEWKEILTKNKSGERIPLRT